MKTLSTLFIVIAAVSPCLAFPFSTPFSRGNNSLQTMPGVQQEQAQSRPASVRNKGHRMSLLNHLKPRYIGKYVHFQRRSDYAKVSRKRSPYKIINVLEKNDEYRAYFKDGRSVRFMFIKSSDYRKSRERERSETMLKAEAVKSQEILNQAIQSFGSSSGAAVPQAQMGSVDQYMKQMGTKNDFTTIKENYYTDLQDGKMYSDYFVVTSKGLYLENGAQLKVLLEIDDEEED